MRRWTGLVTLALTAAAGTAWAQKPAEPEEPAPVRDEESRREPVRSLRVLENPYDISSFYRNRQGRELLDYEAGPGTGDRYPIAGYYRSRQTRRGFGYGSFWNSGYRDVRRGRGSLVVGFRRSIGQNGDLFLLAPTFLAPVGPLTGAFSGAW